MAQVNTQAKAETPEEKIARLTAENAKMAQIVNAGTGPTPSSVKIDIDGNGFTANHRKFSSGSTGFHANGKVTLSDGKRYTVNVLMVEIGSKPTK